MTSVSQYPRLLQVIAPAPFGGAESVARALARAYPGEDSLAVLLQHGGSHPFADQARAEGLPVAEIVGGRRRYDREVAALKRHIDATRPDVVHTHIYHADFVGYFAARSRGLPVVAHVHGITGGDWKDRLYQWFDLKLLRRFDALICVSESVRQRLLSAGCGEERLHLIPNPLSAPAPRPREEARRLLGITPDRPALGWVGRLGIEKGADLLLEALALVPPPRPLAVIIGDGPEMPAIRSQVDRLGLAGDVRLAGAVPDAPALIGAFDALVLSSRTEGTPMTLLEAMGANVPVVAFAVGGIPEAVSEESAWLAPAADVPALAAAMQRAIADPAGSRRRASAAKVTVDARFGIGPWCDRIVALHRRIARTASGT